MGTVQEQMSAEVVETREDEDGGAVRVELNLMPPDNGTPEAMIRAHMLRNWRHVELRPQQAEGGDPIHATVERIRVEGMGMLTVRADATVFQPGDAAAKLRRWGVVVIAPRASATAPGD